MRLHEGEPTLTAGAPLATARAAIVALHGRNATADKIVDFLVAALDSLDDVAVVAPQARHQTWYPKSFMAPFEENEPWLSSALARVGAAVAEVERDGIPFEQIVIFGFSQGACLASEFVARNPRRYGALVAATGGRIGPPGTRFDGDGDLAGTPIHLSAGDPDAHVPWPRVEESAASFRAKNGVVTTYREPGFPHSVHPEAVAFLEARLAELIASS